MFYHLYKIFFSLLLVAMKIEAEIIEFEEPKNEKILPMEENIEKDHQCASVIFFNEEYSTKQEIPRRLFQTWKTHELPTHYSYWSQTWVNFHPEWEFELWDKTENRNFIGTYYPWFLTVYDSYSKDINRADAVRYFYLFTYGGIYANLDTECCKSIDCLLEEKSVILGRMTLEDPEYSIQNAWMASPAKADFWLVVVYCMMNPTEERRPESMTGPALLQQAFSTYLNSKKREEIIDLMKNDMPDAMSIPIQIRPPCELYPLNWMTMKSEKAACAYSITWWGYHWE